MSEPQNQDYEMINVQFSILGQDFILNCKKEDEESLRDSIDSVKNSVAKILRSNPNITPQQACILAALSCQDELNNYLRTKSPFIKKAEAKMEEIEKLVELLRSNG